MFNDLNNANNQGHAAVDDIFAETDKPQDPNSLGNANLSSGIETKRVGLTSDEEINEGASAGGGKWFKIILIVIVATILVLGGYLVYSKFFKASEEPIDNSPVVKTEPAPVAKTEPAPVKTSGSFVEPTSGTVAATSAPEIIPDIPGVNVPATNTPEVVVPPVPAAPVDSDNDGLTDTEEQAAGTNINIIDTDNDGLSDYEEVKMYKTNALSADTDGDGYLDGAEVKGGYDPNGPGKLSKPVSSPK